MRPDANREVIDQIHIEYECGRVSDDIFINTLISQSQRHVQALDIIEAWNSMLIGIPDYRLDMLLQLRERYQVYLLSNTNSLHLEWIHRYMDRTYDVRDFEDRYFDGAYYSHHLGARKPDASIFTQVIEHAELIPEQTFFMDDMPANIEIAKQLGFATKLVADGEEIAAYLRKEGYY
jgi:putative hydrolase of the HAD superfamily